MNSYAFENFNRDVSRNLDLDLYYCGNENCAPGHSFGPGYKDHYKIHYVHEGKGNFTMFERTFQLHARQAFLIYPETQVQYQADWDEPWHYSWVAFDGLSALNYVDRMGFDSKYPIIELKNTEAIERDLGELILASQTEMNRDIKLVGLLYLVLSTFITESSTSRNVGELNFYIDKAVRYMEKNFAQDLKVDQIADYVCLERKYFSKLFKEKTGFSPKEFLIDYRMKKARALMETPSIPIGQVSASVGYKDPLVFSKEFKVRNGCSPREYRNTYAETAAGAGSRAKDASRRLFYDPPRVPYPKNTGEESSPHSS